jgi:ATP-dependent Clp protease ATP-binding subunit ClpC
MGDKLYSNDLKKILSYMVDVLSKEFPTEVFSVEYLIVSILDNSKSHAYTLLDNCLMTSNLEELKNIYVNWLKSNKSDKNLVVKQDNVDFNEELDRILTNAEKERENLKSILVGSEHVLLSMLNPDNKCEKIQEVFKNMGITYNFIIDKCSESSNKEKTNNAPKKIMKKPSMLPLKSEINQQGISSSNEYISKYTINLNQLAKEGKIDELVGRKKEIEKIIKIMARRKKNNVVLVGKGGCGKTAIVNGIADMIVKDEVPQILKNKEVVMLDVMTLVSGTHFRGMFEERVNGLFNELKNSKNHILFIDDIQQILRSGSKEKDTDLSSWIGDILANGEVSVIATTTFKDYRNTIEINTSISRKLQKVVIEPTSIQETIEIIEKTKHYYEDFHNVTYDSDVVKKTVELSQRYITDRSLPDSAIDVIDLSGAYTCLIDREPQQISKMRKRLIDINKERSERLNKGDFEFIDSLNKEENFLKKNISDFNREVEKDKTKYSINITLDNIATSISDMTNIPINKLTLNEKEKIANIENVLKESVVGQDEAIEAVSRIIKRNKVGLGDKNKTLGNLLLLGPSGSGKTLIAKKLAEEIFGSDKALVRIDMSEYSEKNSVAKLTGAAPGYVGFENGGQLTEAIKNKQHCVLLLDEIEKADKEVYNLFLQLFDEGRLTDSAGQMVNFKNVIVLMTSNIGAKQASEMGKGLGFVTDESSNKKSIIEKSLKQTFTPEFINRIDQIVYFNSLSEENLKEIVKLEINKFIKRLNELNYNLTYTEEVVEHLHSFAIKQKEYGARPIIRLIQDKIEDQITDLMLKNEYEENYTFVATYENEGIIIK